MFHIEYKHFQFINIFHKEWLCFHSYLHTYYILKLTWSVKLGDMAIIFTNQQAKIMENVREERPKDQTIS